MAQRIRIGKFGEERTHWAFGDLRFVNVCVLLMVFVPLARPQNLAPVATYKLDLGNAKRCPDGLRFHWALAPDASLLITMWEPRHQWAILRLTGWETRTPKTELMKIPVSLPDVATGCPPNHDPLIDTDGHYLVVRSPEINIGENQSDRQKWEAVASVIDLRTFTVASTVTVFGGLAGGGHLFFGDGGALMLHTLSKFESPLPFAVTVLALPTLDRVASCDYDQPPGGGVIKAGDSCPAVIQAAHLSGIQDLGDLPIVSERIKHLAGPDCDYEALAPGRDLALYRCGKEHFGDPYGDFGIIFWHALKVLSTSDGKTILSFPLRFNDRTSSGVFAHKNGRSYLILRRGSRLLTYQIPAEVTPHSSQR